MTKNKRKYKKRNLWYGWMSEAIEKFDCTKQTIQNRFKKNDYELLNWINHELTKKKEQSMKAKELKKNIRTK